MNEETVKNLWGIVAVLSFAVPFIVLPTILVYGARRKFGKAKAVGERREIKLREPAAPPRPASRGRQVITLVLFSLAGMLFALGTGLASGVLSQGLPFLLVYPALMAFGNGRLMADIVRRARVRTVLPLVILSALFAVISYGTYHYCQYVSFRMQAMAEFAGELSAVTEEPAPQVALALVDYALREETGQTGFTGYMLLSAREGLSVGRLARSASVNLGPVLTWLYRALEFAAILGFTFFKGRKLIDKSFCEACGSWYGAEKHLGGTAPVNEPVLLDLIRQKDFSGLGKLIEQNAGLPSLELYYHGCQVCGKSPSQLVVRHAFQTAKGALQFRDASQTTLQPGESALLLSQVSVSGD